MKTKHIIAICIVLATFSNAIQAQNGINTPYSRYGFGILADRSMGFNKGMAGVAQGMRGGHIVNTANPASYSAVDSLTALFDMGLTLQNGNYKMGALQQNARNTSFDYVAMHFRAARNVGVAFGALPYSNINYDFKSSSITVDGTDDITTSYSFTGNGGLHQAFIGIGWQVFKPISIGVNGGYIFGDYSHTSTMTFSQSSIYSMSREYKADISTWTANFGLQYTQPINKTDRITIGATYGLGHDIKNKALRDTRTYNSSYGIEGQTIDTLRNAFSLPWTISAGVTYYKGTRLTVGADFELQKWSTCKFPIQTDGGTYMSRSQTLNDHIRVSIGGTYTPKGRLSYKAGAYYSHSYAKADITGMLNDKPYEYGITAGITLPISNKQIWYNSPRLNISAGWTHTSIPFISNMSQNIKKQTLSENYLRLSVGLTFSERWFYKYKME
ncbi:MAG: hypothetical protein IJ557_06740 [Bacteroidaceae bacterium]|nr:hypothetical protein [Bacteroidaceae bacterium]